MAFMADSQSADHVASSQLTSRQSEASPMNAVLIVEDEIAIADTLLYALRAAGLLAVHAANLADARRAMLQAVPSLIILDLGLPDGSGLDVCREIRRGSAPLCDVPILMLTAMSDEVDRIVGLELGADDYVAKPFSPREVCLRVKTILRRSGAVNAVNAPAAKALTVADAASVFVVDAAGQRIRYASAWLDLTRRELHILQLLLTRPGHIYSRETVLDRVWGRDIESMERTVDTHIKTLRAKLRTADPTHDPIITHRGLGYSLSLD
jgi:two-component system, OmpR family, catabolic regulation response regulator CreB